LNFSRFVSNVCVPPDAQESFSYRLERFLYELRSDDNTGVDKQSSDQSSLIPVLCSSAGDEHLRRQQQATIFNGLVSSKFNPAIYDKKRRSH